MWKRVREVQLPQVRIENPGFDLFVRQFRRKGEFEVVGSREYHTLNGVGGRSEKQRSRRL